MGSEGVRVRVNIIGKLPPPKGGVTVHNERLFMWLRKRNIDAKFTSINNVDNKDDNVVYVNNMIKWMINHLIKGFDSDIVHYQGANYFGLIYLVLVNYIFKNKFKLVFTIHGEGYINRLREKKLLGFIIRLCFKKIDRIFVGGEHLAHQVKLFKGDTTNVVCVDAFLPPLKEGEKGIPKNLDKLFESNIPVICVNAYNVHLISHKSDLYGLHIISKLAKRLTEENIDCKFIVMIADINNRDYLNGLFSNLDNVVLLSDNTINGWEIISKSDLLIRPTSTDANAISMKEAMMYGVDVIASDVVPRYKGVQTFCYPNVEDLFDKVCYSLNYGFDKVEVENNIDDYIFHYDCIYKMK